jgi:hypothetical protein
MAKKTATSGAPRALSFLDALLDERPGRIARSGFDLENRLHLPLVRRARAYTLHGEDGKKYLDLYRSDGHGLLGYSIPGMGQAVKGRIDQHLWTGLPHHGTTQLLRELERCFPRHEPFVLANWYGVEFLFKALNLGTCPDFLPRASEVWEDSTQELSGPRAAHFKVWLPFTLVHGDVIFAILPGLGYGGPFVVLVDRSFLGREGLNDEDLARLRAMQSMVNPFLVTAALHTLPLLGNYEAFGVEEGKLDLGGRRHEELLGWWRESWWSTVNLHRWKRLGPYLFHPWNPEDYHLVFRFALRQGVVLNPRCDGVSIIPGLMSPGEQRRLEDVLAFEPGAGRV